MREKWTNEDIAIQTQIEGLAYMIQSYLSPERIEDQKLAEMWERARNVLSEIENYLEKYEYREE